MDQRARRSAARFLAPLALIAVIVALLAIISGNGNGNSGGSAGSSASTASTTTPAAKTKTSKKSSEKSKTNSTDSSGAGPKTYTVQVGDTLGAIAAKTGVPLSKIQALNPNVDPHTMNAGQEIRLR